MKKTFTAMNRRKFLWTAGASLALLPVFPGCVTSHRRRFGPNEKVNVACIGVGGRGGKATAEIAKENANIVALCDVDHTYAAKTIAQYPAAKLFKDYRVMLDQLGADIDAVIIGTPDHTHAVIAMEAMRRGKHVYCEKPLAHNIHEVRTLMAAAREHKVVTQLGNQGHASISIRRVCEWIWADAIGPVHTVHAACDEFKEIYCQTGNLAQLGEKFPVPASLDYDRWLGPAPFQPYTPFWVPWKWRGWLAYGNGCLGDWFCHVLDPTFWALHLDAPVTVRAEVTDYDPATQGLTYPSGTRITFEFPAKQGRGPVKIVWHDGNTTIPRPSGFDSKDIVPGTGAVMFGGKGMIVHGSHGGGGCYLAPEDVMRQHSGKNAPPEKITRVKNHAWDWIDAIRTGRAAGSNFGYGGPLTQAALLGVIAIRFPGQTLHWDDARCRFTNNDAANAYINPPYRAGWQL